MNGSTISPEINRTVMWNETSSVNTSTMYDYSDYYNSYENNDDENTFLYYFTIVFLSLQVVIGLIGNSISFIVWTFGKECSNIACSTYFKLLAITDIVALILCGVYLVMFELLRMFDELPLTMCIILDFLLLFVPQLSTWMIVCISVERALTLTFPFSFLQTHARTRAKVAFLVLILVLTGVNCSVFIDESCTSSPDNEDLYKLMLEIASVWTLCVVPLSLIVSCNTITMIQLCLMQRSNAMKRHSSRRLAMFTKFAIASAVLQFLSLFPTMLNYLFWLYDIRTPAISPIILSYVARNTLYLNNSLNFLVYWLSCTQYRLDLKCIFFGKQNRNANQLNERTS